MTDTLEAIRDDLDRCMTRLDAFIASAAAPVQAPAVDHGLADPSAFYAYARQHPPLGPQLTQDEVDGCEAILAACEGWPVSWAAYALGTAYHETAGTLKPIREYGKGAGRKYGVPGKHGGQVAYGRGYVQLTWDAGYERADKELALDGALIADYELALDPKIAAAILRSGMAGGWFTGKSLSTYLPAVATRDQFGNARRIINGMDKADLIAGYAVSFQAALQSGKWS